MICYCVETPAVDQQGVRRGTFRFYTQDRQKAEEQAAAEPCRVFRVLTDEQIPEEVRNNVERAVSA